MSAKRCCYNRTKRDTPGANVTTMIAGACYRCLCQPQCTQALSTQHHCPDTQARQISAAAPMLPQNRQVTQGQSSGQQHAGCPGGMPLPQVPPSAAAPHSAEHWQQAPAAGLDLHQPAGEVKAVKNAWHDEDACGVHDVCICMCAGGRTPPALGRQGPT